MVILNRASDMTLYEQIYHQLRAQILTGKLPENSPLPSTRNLAAELQVSRNTVESAYLQLSSEGYISSKARSGYRVEPIEPERRMQQKIPFQSKQEAICQERNEQGIVDSGKINFQYGRLTISDFPIRTFRKLMNQMLLSAEAGLLLSYNNRKGETELRQEIMKYLHESRGVNCVPEQIILGAGTLSCISLLSQLLRQRTAGIAMEEPGYDSVRHAFINHGFLIEPIPVVKDGIDLGVLKISKSRAVYVTPSHQFPTGVVMPVGKRLELLEWADLNDAFIIEDDYDSELRYSSRPIPSLHSLDGNGRVIYMNTYSKSFAPGMRLSFMVLPQMLKEEYQKLFGRYNCPVPLLEQKVMYAFMKEGHWERHLRKICVSNKKRHDVLVGTILEVMGEQVIIQGKNAGLHIILEVKNGLTEAELLDKADAAGVTVYPVSGYYMEREHFTDNQVLIGFGSLSEEEIIRGIHLLKKAWF